MAFFKPKESIFNYLNALYYDRNSLYSGILNHWIFISGLFLFNGRLFNGSCSHDRLNGSCSLHTVVDIGRMIDQWQGYDAMLIVLFDCQAVDRIIGCLMVTVLIIRFIRLSPMAGL